MSGTAPPPVIDAAARPALLRGVRVHRDEVRGVWALLAPERVLKLDPIAAAVLSEIDGERTFGEVVQALADKYDAPAERIAADASRLILTLADRVMAEVRA
ncbi:pyrroloquinoline quinone biosynthesis peptide chaperone PqqD [Rhodovulum sp. DZ06]|uniref:pyrroloquinoline quinone biosynthesis peptide chaperone PqqD n=1 Tax=Rhodovulum sp. DZ06 TaxID=3425126 RepID=UPI003D349504